MLCNGGTGGIQHIAREKQRGKIVGDATETPLARSSGAATRHATTLMPTRHCGIVRISSLSERERLIFRGSTTGRLHPLPASRMLVTSHQGCSFPKYS